jgi:hypothetical protein
MDIVNDFTDAHLAYWLDLNPEPYTMKAPPGMPSCVDCQALVTDSTDGDGRYVRVAWKPNEIELAQLAQGGTMTDRIRTLTVVLDDDIRVDDLDEIMVKRVADVGFGPVISSDDWRARGAVRSELRMKLEAAIDEVIPWTITAGRT